MEDRWYNILDELVDRLGRLTVPHWENIEQEIDQTEKQIATLALKARLDETAVAQVSDFRKALAGRINQIVREPPKKLIWVETARILLKPKYKP